MRLVILASGSGSNAARIMAHFARPDAPAAVVAVFSDRRAAGVHARARAAGVPAVYLDKATRERPGGLRDALAAYRPDLIALAGYLRLVPEDVLAAYPARVVNIHPALLPKYGGPGMYGHHVHTAVHAASEAYSGITVHLADARYDEGRALFQATVALAGADGPDEIAARVLALEHRHYPLVLERYLAAVQRGAPPDS